ncbi:hypothetical protein PINS_up003955 [Pythium insidiosum]|nr:hypothetical protein PINS_up003955 [Pythium insidiosum]
MKLYTSLVGLLAAWLAVPHGVSGYTNPLVIKNYKFYDSVTGKYFGVRGVDYYPRPNAGELDVNNHDFFTDDHEHIWGPDISYLAAVGANAVRLYAVDPSKSHDKFMCALRANGMYAMIDLGANCKNCAITKDKFPACYPDDLKSRGEQIISVFAKYDNVMAFSAGNEVNHVVSDPKHNAPCQKKFIRDMRAYISRCSTIRDIPVGVVLADTNRDVNALYYNCRTSSSDNLENAEWYGLNVYLHCAGSVTDVSKAAGFQELLSDFKSYKMNIPVMLTEFGCLNPTFPTVDGYEAQRTWLQAGWLHSTAFRAEFSGGFVFEFSTENANSKKDAPYPFTKYGEQNYGLGYFSPETCDHATTKCVFNPMPNYKFLAQQYNATKYDDEPLMSAFTPDVNKVDVPQCPPGFAKLGDVTWSADSVESAACPAKYLAYTCPNQTPSGNGSSKAGSGNGGQTGSSSKGTGSSSKGTGSGSKGNPNTPAPTGAGSKKSDAMGAPKTTASVVSACAVSALLTGLL